MVVVSVIVPAHNESATIEDGLRNILAQQDQALDLEILVVANGCTDDTASIAESLVSEFADTGVALSVFDHVQAGKTRALNFAETRARGDLLFYCDADISMGPGAISAMVAALEDPDVHLVSATQRFSPPESRVVRGWATCYHRSPYQRGHDVVHGLFALRRSSRDRFGSFPETMADDRFLMINFAPDERRRVAEAVITIRYTESVRDLISQQARWIANNADIDARFPELLAANAPSHSTTRWPYFVAPRPGMVDMLCFAAVMVAARGRLLWQRSQILGRWDRARPPAAALSQQDRERRSAPGDGLDGRTH